MEHTSTGRRGWRRFVWYHLPLLVYSGIIIAVSSIPHLKTPELDFVAVDKVAHLFEYALLAFLAFRSAADLMHASRITLAFLLAAVFVSGFAAFDEWYQSFVPGRFSSGWDALADLTGALLVLAFFALRRQRLGRSDSTPESL